MIVRGGSNGSLNGLATGARYTPQNDTWVSMKISGAPSRRLSPKCAYADGKCFVLGGQQGYTLLSDGGIYDVDYDSWTSMPSLDAREVENNIDYFDSFVSGNEFSVFGKVSTSSTDTYVVLARFKLSASSWQYSIDYVEDSESGILRGISLDTYRLYWFPVEREGSTIGKWRLEL